MRVYFLSYLPAALKLNGLYLGGIDSFERHVELDLKDKVLAEAYAGGELQPVSFFIDENLLKNPPAFLDVYLLDSDALIYIREFTPTNIKLSLCLQVEFGQNLITVFKQGNVYATVEGAAFELINLPISFNECTAEEKTVAGKRVLVISGDGATLIISESGKKIFLGEASKVEFGETLEIEVPFETCLQSYAKCSYSYDGENLALLECRTVENVPPDEKILHFAFFESFLTRGDYTKYLTDELKKSADMLYGFLGDYVGVAVPPEKFYVTHDCPLAAGLVYGKKANLFEIKYYCVELENGKIANISPVE